MRKYAMSPLDGLDGHLGNLRLLNGINYLSKISWIGWKATNNESLLFRDKIVSEYKYLVEAMSRLKLSMPHSPPFFQTHDMNLSILQCSLHAEFQPSPRRSSYPSQPAKTQWVDLEALNHR